MTSSPLTDQQLDDIETRANAATPGPWCTVGAEIFQGAEYTPDVSPWIGETCRASGGMGKADAVFAAHARSDVPALLAEVRRLRTELAAAHKQAIHWAAETTDAKLAAEPDHNRASVLYELLLQLRGKLPCTCARSGGLHERCCRKYVPGHELISPANALAAYRRERAAEDAHVVADDSDTPDTGTRQCGHDDYHDAHEWADRPGVWCPGYSHADDEPAPVRP